MDLIARNVTGIVKRADGSLWAGGKVRFSISDTQADGTIIVPKTTVEVICNAQGVFSAPLYTLEGSYLNYDVTLPGGDSQTVSLPDAVGDADLSDLWQVAASADIIAVRVASTTQLGGVKVDGTTITINGSGVISSSGGGGGETTATLGALINAAGAATPNDTDFVTTAESGGLLKKITWTNVKAFLKTLFDTLYQPLNAILTAFVALAPSNDDVLQRKAGAWVNRTIAQLKTDLSLSGTNTGDQDLSSYATKTGAETLTNKTLTAPVINSPTGIVKADVGLGNVDNTSDANKPVSSATATALAAKADNADVVHNSGNETVAGIKTFSISPVVPAPTTDFQAATKKYVDDNAGGGGIGGSTGATDNAILRADGTGGATAQSSSVTLDDSGNITTTGTVKSTLFQAPNGSDTILKTAAGGGDLKIQNAFSEPALQFGDNRRVKVNALTYLSTRPAQITANQNDYALGNANTTKIYLNSDAARNVTGIASTLGVGATNTDDMFHILINNGSFAITLKHEDAASSAANRLLNSTGADIVLAANQAVEIHYDATAARWRVFKKN